MSTSFAAPPLRQAAILASIAGLYVGAFFLVASGLGQYLKLPSPREAPITLVPPAPLPARHPPPPMPRLPDYRIPLLPMPQPDFPRFADERLADLIDACYPSGARRAGEEGRVTVRLAIDAAGRASAWNVERGSGFPRLDAAVGCVIGRLEFLPGRRDGRAVAAAVTLPIVYRLD